MLVVSFWYILLVEPSSCNLHEGTLVFQFICPKPKIEDFIRLHLQNRYSLNTISISSFARDQRPEVRDREPDTRDKASSELLHKKSCLGGGGGWENWPLVALWTMRDAPSAFSDVLSTLSLTVLFVPDSGSLSRTCSGAKLWLTLILV